MTMSARLALARVALQAAQRLSPEAAGWLAERIFCTPPASPVPDRVRPVMARARRSWTMVDGARVAVWRWGKGPAIALAHGWGSRAARLAVYVDPLVEHGFSVVAFDAPGHGASDGTMGSGIQAARALRAVAAATPLYGVVAHSLGAATVLLALDQGLDLRRAAFVAPPSGLDEYADRFAALFGLSAEVVAVMRRRMEARLNFSWDGLDLLSLASRVRGVELLLFHDRDDAEVPWHNGASIARAWPGAVMVTTEGLGHHRIARDPRVVAAIVQFMAAGIDQAGAAGELWLNQELFERERRQRLAGV